MKKALLILLFLFSSVHTGYTATLSLGPSIHYEPTAGSFELGSTEWTYSQETISLGLSSTLQVNNQIRLDILERFIFGSTPNGSNISIVGQKLDASIIFQQEMLLKLNYSFESYWNNQDISTIYQMCTAPIHRVSFDFTIPILNITLFR